MRISTGWQGEQWPSLEHVRLTGDDDGWCARGSVVIADGELTSVRYEFRCDQDWRFTGLDITASAATGDRTLTLGASAAGDWTANGAARPDLAGCTDIDIDCTPVTNTLPVRRLSWTPGQARDLTMAYVSVPGLTVRPAHQRYTFVRAPDASRPAVYRYETATFRADLTIDSDGLVVDYEGIWQRIGRVPTADGSIAAR